MVLHQRRAAQSAGPLQHQLCVSTGSWKPLATAFPRGRKLGWKPKRSEMPCPDCNVWFWNATSLAPLQVQCWSCDAAWNFFSSYFYSLKKNMYLIFFLAKILQKSRLTETKYIKCILFLICQQFCDSMCFYSTHPLETHKVAGLLRLPRLELRPVLFDHFQLSRPSSFLSKKRSWQHWTGFQCEEWRAASRQRFSDTNDSVVELLLFPWVSWWERHWSHCVGRSSHWKRTVLPAVTEECCSRYMTMFLLLLLGWLWW